jgi:hypothetical protein
MPSISLPTLAIIAAAGTAVAAGVSAYESHEAGVAAAKMDKRKATAEAISASQKQIDMRQNMLRALASQNAGSLGAVGTGGGFGANVKRQIDQAQNDVMVSRANASGQISLLDQAGANARAEGDIGAFGDLAKGAASYAGLRG